MPSGSLPKQGISGPRCLAFCKGLFVVVLAWNILIDEQLPFGGACASTRVAMADVEGAFADTVPDWGGSGQCMAPSCGGRFDEGMTVKYFSDLKYP